MPKVKPFYMLPSTFNLSREMQGWRSIFAYLLKYRSILQMEEKDDRIFF